MSIEQSNTTAGPLDTLSEIWATLPWDPNVWSVTQLALRVEDIRTFLMPWAAKDFQDPLTESAPQLLAALQRALEATQSACGGHGDYDDGWISEAEEAIAQARKL